MEMSLSHVQLEPWVRVTFASLFFYPFILWLSTFRASSAPVSASVVPAVLTPLVFALGAAWFGLSRLFEVLELTGADRIVRAAGIAEVQSIVAFAAAVGAVIAAAASVREFLRRRTVAPEDALSGKWRVVAIVLLSMAAFELYTLSNAATVILTGIGSHGRNPLLLAASASAFLGAAASLVWLVASRRTAAARFADRRTASVLSAVVAAAISYSAWQVMGGLQEAIVRGYMGR
jgi:hypothetical protein